jgi:hypothetical protein
MLKLNLGCGFHKREGFLNVDQYAGCEPDAVVDLENFPWPWDEGSVDEVMMCHVLEHLGETNAIFFGIIGELYRVCRAGSRITITVPHPRHDDFLIDPTHVRPVAAEAFAMLSQANCRKWAEEGIANTPLALHLGVDFEVLGTQMALDEPWRSRYAGNEISAEDLAFAIRHYMNVVKETTTILTPVKNG